MKRLLALFFSFCIILSSTISVEAKSLDDYSSTYIEYISDDLYAEVTLSVAPQNNNSSFSKSATTSSTGGLVLALKRAFLLLAQKGGIASTFTGPL